MRTSVMSPTRGIPVTHRDHACELCGVDLLSERAILCRHVALDIRKPPVDVLEPRADVARGPCWRGAHALPEPAVLAACIVQLAWPAWR